MPQPNDTPFDLPETAPAGVEGNLYPRDGATYDDGDQYFDQPRERTEEEREEANEQASAIPFLKQIHEWFDEQIAACDSIDNIQVGDITIPMGDNTITVPQAASIETQVYAMQLLKQRLLEKKNSFPELGEADE